MSRTKLSPLIKAQVEKLTAANGGGGGGGQRLINSSSPMIIPKKSSRSNPSSQSSSSYTSVADQMSSLGETSLQIHREFDNTTYTSLPMLSSTCQQLEHQAARDRIAVKNKRRQPIKEKLNILKENNDTETDLFSSTVVEDEQIIVVTPVESKAPQPTVDLPDLDTARSRLRVSVRPRDHSADNILSSTSIVPTYVTSVQRSISFKRPQEISNRSVVNHEKTDEEENKTETKPSSKEHIYDNLDLFKHHRLNNNNNNKAREQSIPRLRPVTMYISNNDNKQTINEFENVFNQLKKRALNKKLSSKDEEPNILSEEPVKPTMPSISIQETSVTLVTENEPTNSVVIATEKKVEISSVTKAPNRRKTVSGVNLTANNKIATEDNTPTPSWIDIAKQKQNKFQSISIEKTHQNESESTVVSKTQMIIVNENSSEEKNSTILARRPSPTHSVERDSIRALKAGSPNRINNLIQFFDK